MFEIYSFKMNARLEVPSDLLTCEYSIVRLVSISTNTCKSNSNSLDLVNVINIRKYYQQLCNSCNTGYFAPIFP